MPWRGWHVCLEIWIARFCAQVVKLLKGSHREGRDLAK